MDKRDTNPSVARLARAIWNQYGETIMKEWEEDQKVKREAEAQRE